MALTIAEFTRLEQPAPVVIHSLERSLYQVTVVLQGQEQLLIERRGRPFRCRNLEQVRERLNTLPVASITLRHQSSYDEMIGQPPKQEANTLEVPLSLNNLPPTPAH